MVLSNPAQTEFLLGSFNEELCATKTVKRQARAVKNDVGPNGKEFTAGLVITATGAFFGGVKIKVKFCTHD